MVDSQSTVSVERNGQDSRYPVLVRIVFEIQDKDIKFPAYLLKHERGLRPSSSLVLISVTPIFLHQKMYCNRYIEHQSHLRILSELYNPSFQSSGSGDILLQKYFLISVPPLRFLLQYMAEFVSGWMSLKGVWKVVKWRHDSLCSVHMPLLCFNI